jgi:hypothetical protein
MPIHIKYGAHSESQFSYNASAKYVMVKGKRKLLSKLRGLHKMANTPGSNRIRW